MGMKEDWILKIRSVANNQCYSTFNPQHAVLGAKDLSGNSVAVDAKRTDQLWPLLPRRPRCWLRAATSQAEIQRFREVNTKENQRNNGKEAILLPSGSVKRTRRKTNGTMARRPFYFGSSSDVGENSTLTEFKFFGDNLESPGSLYVLSRIRMHCSLSTSQEYPWCLPLFPFESHESSKTDWCCFFLLALKVFPQTVWPHYGVLTVSEKHLV